MKKIVIPLLFLFLICSACNSEGGLRGFFSKTDSEPAFEQGEYVLPQPFAFAKYNQNFLQDTIYPIGWSYDGSFAYLNQIADEACGCTYVIFAVLNTSLNITEVVFEYNDNGDGMTVEGIWDKKYEILKKTLLEKKVKQFHKFELHSAKFGSNNINYEMELTVERVLEPEYAIELVDKASIVLQSRKLGQKNVVVIDYSSPYFILDAAVVGVFVSPYRKHVAILYKEEKIGYEGPPHTIGLIAIGTNLTDNF